MIENFYALSQAFIANLRKDYYRYFFNQYPLDNRFSIISGPRGVGKTTILIQYLLKFTGNNPFSEKALYIQADHFMLGQHSLYEIAEQLTNEGGLYFFIDEIHKYTNWTQELKSIYDTFPKLKLISSGSSALELYHGSYDLSRRAIVYSLPEMSFREFIELYCNLRLNACALNELFTDHQRLADEIIKKVEQINRKILPLFREYLEFGCYPYFNEFNDKNLFHITLEQGVHATIESDLPAIHDGLNGIGVKRIKKLLSFIAESAPFTPDLSKIKRLLEIGDERTLKLYLKYLEDAGLILSVSKKGRVLKSLEKPEKIYLHNTNLMHALGNKEYLQKGNLRETFVANILSLITTLSTVEKGDFLAAGKYIIEVGGKNKDFIQIKDLKDSYLVVDDMEIGTRNRIPLWLFGFLY